MIAKVFKCGNELALMLPRELQPKEGEVQIEVLGDCWIVSPVKPIAWPKGFFSRIQISKPGLFARPSLAARRREQARRLAATIEA